MELLHLIQKGVYVKIIIEGRMHMPWVSYYVLLLFTFLTATMAYLFLYCSLETQGPRRLFHQEA